MSLRRLALLSSLAFALGACVPGTMFVQKPAGPSGTDAAKGPYALRLGDPKRIWSGPVDRVEFGPEGRVLALRSHPTLSSLAIRQADGSFQEAKLAEPAHWRGFHAFSSEDLVVGGEGGKLWRLKQVGGSWQVSALSSGTGEAIFDLQFNSPQEGYFCTLQALHGTQDGGQSWRKLAPLGGQKLVASPTGQGVVLEASGGLVHRWDGQQLLALKEATEQGTTMELRQARLGGGRLWCQLGTAWIFTTDLQSWTRPGPSFQSATRPLEGRPDVALPFSKGAYLRNAAGFFYWPGEGQRVSNPTAAPYSPSSQDHVAPDGTMFYSSAEGLEELQAPADLQALLGP